MSPSRQHPWWDGGVVYQIYPRSFCLADPPGRRERLGMSEAMHPNRIRDGAGDLEGIRRHLDHVADLGADAIWLSPIFTSPMADFGYDVADYCDIDPLFGTLSDLDLLVADAHERNIKVLLDWVPNHTSDRHPWFLAARSSRDDPKRNWYIWRDPDPDRPERPPNNWKRSFGEGPAWTFDNATGQWYLHLFLPQQPDLNWANPQVELAMFATLDFWIERGIDGFRIDVVHGIVKPDGLPDVDSDVASTPYSALNDEPGTHAVLRRLRRHLERHERAILLVGEVFLLDAAKVAPYYGTCGDASDASDPGVVGDRKELDLAFNFTTAFTKWSASSFRRRFEEIEREIVARGAVPTFVLSNHDRPRHKTRFGGSERRARAVAVMALAARGTIFLYAGEELGLEDAPIPAALVVDPGGRDGCRAPLPWDATPAHGWALEGREPWLPFPPGSDRLAVFEQVADPESMLKLYKRLVAERRLSPGLRHGELELLDAGDEEVLAFSRRLGDDERIVIVNFATDERPTLLRGSSGPTRSLSDLVVSVSTDPSLEASTYRGQISGEQGVICRPRP